MTQITHPNNPMQIAYSRTKRRYFANYLLPYSLFSLFALFLTACASNGDSGLESYNRKMYAINKTVDEYTLKPVAKAYKAVTPDLVEKGVSNFFSNIGELNTFANSILQGKLHNAAVSSSRIVWNTTVGLGGIFDVASSFDLKSDPEDFGQTLRYWGVPAGEYIVLPLLGPSTLTDTLGRFGDYSLSPYGYYQWSDHAVKEGVTVLRAVNTRAKLLGITDNLNNVGTDEYLFVKNAYLQRREALANNQAQEDKVDEAFDELFFDNVAETIK